MLWSPIFVQNSDFDKTYFDFYILGNQIGRYTTSSGEIYEGSYDNTSRKNPIYKKNTYFYVPRWKILQSCFSYWNFCLHISWWYERKCISLKIWKWLGMVYYQFWCKFWWRIPLSKQFWRKIKERRIFVSIQRNIFNDSHATFSSSGILFQGNVFLFKLLI